MMYFKLCFALILLAYITFYLSLFIVLNIYVVINESTFIIINIIKLLGRDKRLMPLYMLLIHTTILISKCRRYESIQILVFKAGIVLKRWKQNREMEI